MLLNQLQFHLISHKWIQTTTALLTEYHCGGFSHMFVLSHMFGLSHKFVLSNKSVPFHKSALLCHRYSLLEQAQNLVQSHKEDWIP